MSSNFITDHPTGLGSTARTQGPSTSLSTSSDQESSQWSLASRWACRLKNNDPDRLMIKNMHNSYIITISHLDTPPGKWDSEDWSLRLSTSS